MGYSQRLALDHAWAFMVTGLGLQDVGTSLANGLIGFGSSPLGGMHLYILDLYYLLRNILLKDIK